MVDIKEYEGMVTGPDLFLCMTLATNKYNEESIQNIKRSLQIKDYANDFYTVSKKVFQYVNALETHYLSITESSPNFARRIFGGNDKNISKYLEYESLVINLNQSKHEYVEKMSQENLERFSNSLIEFYGKIRKDFYINNSIETEESTVFALLYPLIHAGQRVGDFYKKEASKEKNPWPIQLDEKQKKELDSKMELKILSSIDKNFQVLEKSEKRERVNKK